MRTVCFDAEDGNTLSAEIGTSCPQGEDLEHGGLTILRLKDEGGTDMRMSFKSKPGTAVVLVHGDDGSESVSSEHVQEIFLTFEGDSECETLIRCLEFAVETLKNQRITNRTRPKIDASR